MTKINPVTAPLRPQSAELFSDVLRKVASRFTFHDWKVEENDSDLGPPIYVDYVEFVRIILEIAAEAYARAAAPQPESVSAEMRVWVLGKYENGDDLVYGVTARPGEGACLGDRRC